MDKIYKITSFTHLFTGEGHRIAYTFSTMDSNGNIISQNEKGNYVVVDPTVEAAINTIINDILSNHLK